jgi:hypothetical protein
VKTPLKLEEEEEEVKEVKFNQQGRNGTQTVFDE